MQLTNGLTPRLEHTEASSSNAGLIKKKKKKEKREKGKKLNGIELYLLAAGICNQPRENRHVRRTTTRKSSARATA